VRYRALMSSMGRIAVASDRAGEASVRLEAVPALADIRVLVRPGADAVEDLAAEWTALAANASEPNAFAEHWFVAASLPNMAGGRDIRLMEVRRAGRLIGILPVAVEKGYARLRLRTLQNWCHDQMFLGTPLVAAGEEGAFWTAILDALDEADWAPNLLHLRGITEGGPVHRALGRRGAVVHREIRAFLESDLSPQAYYEQAVRQKKRKEIRRLRNRLAETGGVSAQVLDDGAALGAWCDTYLAIEKAGWKGAAGSALACTPATERFFRDAVEAAWGAGRLQFLRLDAGGKTIAMLVNFLSPPGSFSFKTVFDEDYARFSPGVLIQIENLAILANPEIRWMDSCAAEDHPMIDSLWTERRNIVRITIRLKGARRAAVFAFCRALELGSAAVRKLIR
jgi:CelD/BcsL family acetyltransferase involved in cellulose biosynthesis